MADYPHAKIGDVSTDAQGGPSRGIFMTNSEWFVGCYVVGMIRYCIGVTLYNFLKRLQK